MKTSSACPSLLAAALVAASLPALAGRPFVTEDAGVLDRGACEWESLAAHASAGGSASESAWATQVGCGIGLSSQLGLGYGQARSGGDHASALSIGGKTGLADGAGGGPALALAWGATWVRGGGASGFDSALLNLVASQPFGDGWTAHANLGLLRVHAPRETQTTWALALEKTVAEGLDLGAETYGEGSGKPWLALGLRWQAAEAWSLNASLASQSGSPRAKLLALGVKFAF